MSKINRISRRDTEIEASILQLEELNRRGSSLEQFDQKQIEEIAEKYSNKGSSALAGVVGGIIGGSAGIGLGAIATGTLILTGPAGLLLGASLGVLAWRGRRYQHLERETEKLNKALDSLEKRLRLLPRDAPKRVRDLIWEEYTRFIRQYGAEVTHLLTAPTTNSEVKVEVSRPELDVVDVQEIEPKEVKALSSGEEPEDAA